MPSFPLACADCGQPMQRGPGSLPQGQARCRPCRRRANPPLVTTGVRRLQPGDIGACTRCERDFVAQVPGQRLCQNPCRRRERGTSAKPVSTTGAGYGAAHRRARARALAAWQDGDPCARCAGPMSHGTPVHLDHTDDRTGYLGLSHAACNARHTNRDRGTGHDAVCDHCGCTCRVRWSDQRFCSAPCRKAAPRRPRKVKPPRPERPRRMLPRCTECGGPVTTPTSVKPVCHPCRPARSQRIQASAVRTGQTWQPWEIDLLKPDRVSVLALAERLQRTVTSVKTKRVQVRERATRG